MFSSQSVSFNTEKPNLFKPQVKEQISQHQQVQVKGRARAHTYTHTRQTGNTSFASGQTHLTKYLNQQLRLLSEIKQPFNINIRPLNFKFYDLFSLKKHIFSKIYSVFSNYGQQTQTERSE